MPERYNSACKVVSNIMTQCINANKPYYSNRVTAKQLALSTTYYTGNFKLQNLYPFITEEVWDTSATTSQLNILQNISITVNYKPGAMI